MGIQRFHIAVIVVIVVAHSFVQLSLFVAAHAGCGGRMAVVPAAGGDPRE